MHRLVSEGIDFRGWQECSCESGVWLQEKGRPFVNSADLSDLLFDQSLILVMRTDPNPDEIRAVLDRDGR